MTDHNREELIEEHRGVIAVFGDMSPIGNLSRRTIRALEDAAFEQAHTPTDDCPRCGNDPEDCYCNDEDMIAFREAGGFRRPAPPELQTEPTDAQVLAGLNAEQAHDRQVNGMRPVVEESKSLDDWHSLNIERMRAVLRAALKEGECR